MANLRDIYEKLGRDSNLGDTRKRDLRSALSSLARWVGRPLELVSANPASLRPQLAKLSAARLGVKRKRLQNVVSGVNVCLRRYGTVAPKTPLNAFWRKLRAAIPDKYVRNGTVAFARYCSERGIGPTEVSDEISQSFLRYLEEETLRKNPKGIHRTTVRLWNCLADKDIDLPRLALPDYRKPKITLAEIAFQPSLIADIDTYCRWLRGDLLFNERPPPNVCRSSTVNLRRKQLVVLASAAVRRGVPITEICNLSDLTSKRVAQAAIEGMFDLGHKQQSQYVQDLIKALYSVHKHWVKGLPDDLEWYRDILRRLPSPEIGLTEKNRTLLRFFDDSSTIKKLLDLPECLYRRAESGRLNDRRSAVLFQVALAIDILTYAPIRIGNLIAIELTRNIQLPNHANEHAFIVIPPEQVKNNVSLEFRLNDRLTRRLTTYVTQYLPQLGGADCTWLFPGASPGHQKSSRTLSQQLTETIDRELGIRMTPHQFRHLAAKLYLDRNPGNYEVIRRTLGHKNMKTTVNFYAGLETNAATKAYDETIRKLREEGGQNV
jgi:integrase